MVDLDPRALKATGLTPSDVVGAISAQNLILPTGTAKIGAREYSVRVNSSPDTVEGLNNLPIKQINGAVVYIRDVAQVRDGFAVQTNIVSQGGRRASLVTIFKSGGASTLDVVQRIKDMLPKVQATLPPELDLKLMFDQSVFVRAAVDGVVREAIARLLSAEPDFEVTGECATVEEGLQHRVLAIAECDHDASPPCSTQSRNRSASRSRAARPSRGSSCRCVRGGCVQ
jgi:multidrug efflux pump subunit AcrB